MTYIEHIPCNQLNLFIEKIWFCHAADLTGTTLTIPLPNPELVINLSGIYRVRKEECEVYTSQDPAAWVNGLQSSSYFSYSSGPHEMLGVLFKVNGLKAFSKHPASDFSDNFINAQLVFGRSIETLINRLQNTVTVCDKFVLVEKFLFANLTDVNYPGYLSYSISQLSSGPGAKGCIRDLCRQISISNKSLIGAFGKFIGISPVKYAHLQAVNQALLLLSKTPKQSLTKLAYALNFYDQSHFTSLFKSITSLTPSRYAAHVINKTTDTGSPNFIVVQG